MDLLNDRIGFNFTIVDFSAAHKKPAFQGIKGNPPHEAQYQPIDYSLKVNYEYEIGQEHSQEGK